MGQHIRPYGQLSISGTSDTSKVEMAATSRTHDDDGDDNDYE